MITRIGPQVSRAWPCSSWAPRRGGEWNARKCRICRPGSGSCELDARVSSSAPHCCSSPVILISSSTLSEYSSSLGHKVSNLVTFSVEFRSLPGKERERVWSKTTLRLERATSWRRGSVEDAALLYCSLWVGSLPDCPPQCQVLQLINLLT